MWERWQRGESLYRIAERLATRHSSIRQMLARTGLLDHHEATTT